MGVLSDKNALVASRPIFEQIYKDYNKRSYVSPDPLQFLYNYPDPKDREIVGLIASSLAYGRVTQIINSITKVLRPLGTSPAKFLVESGRDDISRLNRGFVHRFTDEAAITDFLRSISEILKRNGTLESLFFSHYSGDIRNAEEGFVAELRASCSCGSSFLLPLPSKGSACKRLALFLRWMVRKDEVDPGGWSKITPDRIIVPVDTHMFHICSELGLCSCNRVDSKAAREITESFRAVCPEDPVKYDFALTRFGIRDDMTLGELFAKWGKPQVQLFERTKKQRRP